MGRTPTPGLAPPSPSRVPGPVLGTINTHAKQRYHPAWSSRPGREAGQGTGSNDLSVTGKNQGPGAPAASERERESAPDRESSLHGSLNSLERVSHGDAKLLGHLANQTRQSAGGLRRTKELGGRRGAVWRGGVRGPPAPGLGGDARGRLGLSRSRQRQEVRAEISKHS